MNNFVDFFLSIPVGGRVSILIGIVFLLWCILGRLILKLVSAFLWILIKALFVLYILVEIPVSILHSKFGSTFGTIDQCLATSTEKICSFMSKWFIKTNKPKTIYCKHFFAVCLVICVYLLVPVFANLTEKAFTFWQESYIEKEASVIQWMDDKGWLEK